MDRKYLSAPFDMSEYIFGERFVLGGIDFDSAVDTVDDKDEKLKEEDDKRAEPLTPSEGR